MEALRAFLYLRKMLIECARLKFEDIGNQFGEMMRDVEDILYKYNAYIFLSLYMWRTLHTVRIYPGQ